MPRDIIKKPRLIYPQIATSLSIAEVSAMAELLFWRILPQADDQGRLPGDPRQLKAMVCPMREELTQSNIRELLVELENADIIIQYSKSSTAYIQIARWWDYQSAMRRIFPSHYPPPDGWKDFVKGVSDRQTGTNADNVRPEPEEEEEPEIETRISKPEVEEEDEAATAVTETAIESKLSENHEGSKRATETAEISRMLGFLETLEGWRLRRAEDIAWLKEFCQDQPGFGLPFAKACRDYHSGRPPPKQKGVWKNRFRNWMEQEEKHRDNHKGGKDGADKKRDSPSGPLSRKPIQFDPYKPLR